MDQPNTQAIEQFWRSANYICVAMLHLQNNVLLRQPLKSSDFKETILGHWGACPGVNAIYAQISDLIRRTGQSMRFVLGTGHAGPAILANLFLEGTLGEIYPRYLRSEEGLQSLVCDFATPNGLDTEICPKLPGMLYVGGELGAALAFAQGCAFNDPDSVTICVIGDGELETSITQASWQGFKFLSARQDGKVLPIINANGNKMGSVSLFGLKSRQEQTDFFSGHGMYPIFVGTDHTEFAERISEAYELLETVQPVIVFESPKGWTAPELMLGTPFSGTYKSHKPVLRNPMYDNQAAAIQDWLKNYQPDELFDIKGRPSSLALACLPNKKLLMGNGHALTRRNEIALTYAPITAKTSVDAVAEILAEILQRHSDVLVFSPDELTSNRFGLLLDASHLKFGTAHEGVNTLGPEGQVIEILNEHMCHAWAQGYAMSGRKSVCISYEAFAPLFDSMTAQHLKFLARSKPLTWRPDVPSINIILTSLGWNNCPTHQNPGYIDTLLGRGLDNVRIYTPSTPQSAAQSFKLMMESYNGINVMIIGKYQLPKLSTVLNNAEQPFQPWRILKKSTNSGVDVSLVPIGDCMAEECLHAKDIIEAEYPDLAVQVVSVEEASLLENQNTECDAFKVALKDCKSSVWAYIGYPNTIRGMLWGRGFVGYHSVVGYKDKGTTVSGLDRFLENEASRYHIAYEAIKNLVRANSVHRPEILTQKYPGFLKPGHI